MFFFREQTDVCHGYIPAELSVKETFGLPVVGVLDLIGFHEIKRRHACSMAPCARINTSEHSRQVKQKDKRKNVTGNCKVEMPAFSTLWPVFFPVSRPWAKPRQDSSPDVMDFVHEQGRSALLSSVDVSAPRCSVQTSQAAAPSCIFSKHIIVFAVII